MAEKDLRRMNRTELIEIIYALQKNEQALIKENNKLQKQLDDKFLRIKNAGFIAEAALSLNHIFEDADAAAKQYVAAVKAANESAATIIKEAKWQSDEMISNAENKARQTEKECSAMLEETEQSIQRKKAAFKRSIKRTLEKYPELAERMKEENSIK
ncbi:MAG: hypothetical protein LUE88_00500 [Clostridiales bacterium]|nr:hypothetical protein [Clostridiales bacterium]